MQQSDHQKSASGRPSLFSTADQSVPGGERILNSGPGVAAPSAAPPRRLVNSVILLAVLGVCAAGAWFVQKNGSDTLQAGKSSVEAVPPLLATASGNGAPVPGAPAATSAAPITAGSAPAAALATESTAAVLVNETPIGGKSLPETPARRQNQLASALEAGVTPNPTALKSALEAKPASSKPVPVKSGASARTGQTVAARSERKAPAKSEKTVKTASVAKTPVAKKTAIAAASKNTTKSVAATSKKPASVVAKKAPPVVDVVARQMNGDVDLISALVSHSNENELKEPQKPARSPSVPTAKKTP